MLVMKIGNSINKHKIHRKKFNKVCVRPACWKPQIFLREIKDINEEVLKLRVVIS